MTIAIENKYFRSLVSNIEKDLAQFYAFNQKSNATEHLIEKENLKQHLGESVTEQREWKSRAAVWLSECNTELFIGIHFSSEIPTVLNRHKPDESLCDNNLDAFTTVVEEVSHFHLILNRASEGRNVTRVELETQGEIDKLLIAAMYLERQSGRAHLLPLARRLFDQSKIVSDDRTTYWEATKQAARIWFNLAASQAGITSQVRNRLRAHYNASNQQKKAQQEEFLGAA